MEKYGCNRAEEIQARIDELSNIRFKTADEKDEVRELKEVLEEIKHVESQSSKVE